MSLANSACSAKLARASGPSGESSHQSSARKPPDLPDAAQATPERSTTVTSTPRRARKYAVAAPMTPAPQTTTCRGRITLDSSWRPWLVDDRLADHLPEKVACGSTRRTRRALRHQHGDHLVLRVHPERRAGRTAPAILADRARHGRDARRRADGESETEAIPLAHAAARDDLHRAQMIGRHERHGGRAEQTRAVELAAVEQHLREARVVRRRPRAARAAGVVLRRHGDVDELDRLSGAGLDGERLR